MRETEILVGQQPPQGVLVCDHAGRVINQSSLSAEPRGSARHRAVERPVPSLTIEHVHLVAVPLQFAGDREGLATGGAGVGAVDGMGANVFCQGTGVREGVAAGGAGVGAVSSMCSHVCRQVTGLPEGLAAGGAGVGAVASMGTDVLRQAAGLREGVTAGGACVGTVSGMGAHVSGHVARLR